jgi:putative lipoic acid-binding regulatory protein
MLDAGTKQRLKEKLEHVHEWPGVYMFKFIFEPDADRLSRVLALFPPESEVLRKYSKGGKYLSLTVKEVMITADDVVDRYDRASEISGVIVL